MKFIRYLKRTWKSKLFALAIVAFGAISILIENDLTFFVLSIAFAVPIFLFLEDEYE